MSKHIHVYTNSCQNTHMHVQTYRNTRKRMSKRTQIHVKHTYAKTNINAHKNTHKLYKNAAKTYTNA